jgi:hypothetical protein
MVWLAARQWVQQHRHGNAGRDRATWRLSCRALPRSGRLPRVQCAAFCFVLATTVSSIIEADVRRT